MVRIEPNSACAVPVWLFVAVIASLTLRLGLGALEYLHPQPPACSINWRKVSDRELADGNRGEKLRLYYFETAWSDTCRQMTDTTFLSRDVIGELNRDFVPVKVTDRKREDGKNAEPTQKLEDLFSVQAFPSFVVAMPDQTKISDHLGSLNPRAMKSYLQEALTLSAYFRGKEYSIAGDLRSAALAFDDFLGKTKWQHWRSVFAAIFSSIAHRGLGEPQVAGRMIAEALEMTNDHSFPYPILKCLAGKLSFDELLKEASENKGNRILCYAYTGMDCSAAKRYGEARSRLQWVVDHCEDKSSFEYRMARAELKRIKDRQAGIQNHIAQL